MYTLIYSSDFRFLFPQGPQITLLLGQAKNIG